MTWRLRIAVTCVALVAAALSLAPAVEQPLPDDTRPATRPAGRAWTAATLQAAARGVTVSDERLAEEIATAPSDERDELRADLQRLAGAWAQAGGEDGHPFWERAWRRYEAGALPASALRDYTVSYRELLVRQRGEVDGERVRTEAGRAVRQRLSRALDLRIAALDDLADYVAVRQVQREPEDPDRVRAQYRGARAGLQASYLATRRAMNTSQTVLEAAGLEPLSEQAFV